MESVGTLDNVKKSSSNGPLGFCFIWNPSPAAGGRASAKAAKRAD
jgi:hypothetical protein